MIKVAGCWEQGWTTPIMEYDLWRFPLRDFGVDEFIMTPISGITGKVTEFSDIGTVIKANPKLTVVFVDENGGTELSDFDHPEDVIYICGRAGYSPMDKKEISVRIDTPGKGGRLWPHQAMAIVLHDRNAKL